MGHGRTSETFRLRDGRIIKMLSASVPQSRAERELRLAQEAAAAGLPVWQIQELVRCGDRWGLLGEALPGETVSLARRLLQRPWELNHWFSAFIDLHQQINRTPAAHLPPIRRRLARRIRSSGLPEEAAAAVQRQLRQLPEGHYLCHGDLHPANVLVAEGRLLAIDWASAGRGPVAFDAARSIFLLRFGSAPGLASRLLQPLRKRYAHRYREQRLEEEGLCPELLKAWQLPILAARLVRRKDSERSYFTQLLQELQAAQGAAPLEDLPPDQRNRARKRRGHDSRISSGLQ